MGQIYNVLIILVITLVMALATAAVAYFVDFIPWVVDGNGTESANTSFGSPQLD